MKITMRTAYIMLHILPYNCLYGYYSNIFKNTEDLSVIRGVLQKNQAIRAKYFCTYWSDRGYIYMPYIMHIEPRILRIYVRHTYVYMVVEDLPRNKRHPKAAHQLANYLYRKNAGSIEEITQQLPRQFELLDYFKAPEHYHVNVRRIS
jgi:hypothetical protein